MASQRFLLGARVRARVLRSALDLELAAGADPSTSPALNLRAAQLRQPRARRRIAKRLRRTMTGVAGSDRSGLSPLARSEIFEESDALMTLVDRLEDTRPVEVMGIALANLIASQNPLIVGHKPGTLHTTVRLASIAMDASPRAVVVERFLQPSPAGGHPRNEDGAMP